MQYTKIEDLPELSDIDGTSYMRDTDKYSKYIRKHNVKKEYNNSEKNNDEPLPGIEKRQTHTTEYLEDPITMTPIPISYKSINCIDICNHIKDCPLCSKFYNNDNSLYIGSIIFLSIVILLLIKKICNL